MNFLLSTGQEPKKYYKKDFIVMSFMVPDKLKENPTLNTLNTDNADGTL